MGSGEVAIVALSTMISLKVTFSDGLGGYDACLEHHTTSKSYAAENRIHVSPIFNTYTLASVGLDANRRFLQIFVIG